jgi:polysaccharide biosynthesis transport protein
MNPTNPSNINNGRPVPAGFSADDAIFMLFRHKWLILGFVCLGLAGAVVVRFVKPPVYVSQAKLKVHYVPNRGEIVAATPNEPHTQSLDAGAQNVIAAEVDILTSLDVAKRAAESIGPEKILAKSGGGTNLFAAAGLICSGIEVDPPRSSVLTISFKCPDAEIVQPILTAVLEAYMRKHQEINLIPVDDLLKQRDELRNKLTQTEDKLKRQKIQANMPFPEDASRSIQRSIARAQDELMDAERDLLERKAILGDKYVESTSRTNGIERSVPPELLSSYTFASSRLEELNRQKSELLLQYTEAYPLVQNVQDRITKLAQQKAELEARYPDLAHLQLRGTQSGTNAATTEALIARAGALRVVLSNVQAQASIVMDVQPKIAELERLRLEEQRTYDLINARLEERQREESLVAGKVINMSTVQDPAPPRLDSKKMMKLVGMVLIGCIAMGLGLAFVIEQFLDRSIKRSSDIEKHLRLPVFLSIPDTTWKGWFRPPRWLQFIFKAKRRTLGGASGNGASQTGSALVPWDPSHQLRKYADGLRERVISYFEVQNLNQKKPKLVAVTGCTEGAGVSTLASGLAVALSNTGDGNVLLVDMNEDQGVAHSFYKGRPGCGIAAALQPENRADAQVQENLYLATLHNGADSNLAKVLPTRFNHLMPRLKASDYDYIIFDMPPVTQTSATPRMASYMDLALLVIESEKTGQHAAARACGLMREARASVAAVLNKHRSHMPAGLSQEA